MIGFKLISKMTVEECFRFLSENDSSRMYYNDVKARFFELVDNLTLEKAYQIVGRYKSQKDSPLFLAIKNRFEKLTDEEQKKEDEEFHRCESILVENDCDYAEGIEAYKEFVSIYKKKKPEYKARHLEEAGFQIKVLQELYDLDSCQTIADYDSFINKYEKMAEEGCHATNLSWAKEKKEELVRVQEEERERQWILKEKRRMEKLRLMKRIFSVFCAVVIIAIAIVLLCGLRFVRVLDAKNVEFGKGGGAETVRIETNVSSRAIDVSLPDTDWLTAEIKYNRISLNAQPNVGGLKECDIRVIAYSTFYGKRIRISWLTKTIFIHITQESGLAPKIEVDSKALPPVSTKNLDD